MNINDPFIGEYEIHHSSKSFTIAFDGRSECGMGGPIHGELIVSNFISTKQALACVLYSEETEELGYMTWRQKDGGAVIDVHVTDFNQTKSFEVQFGALRFVSISHDQIILTDTYSGEAIKIVRA
ncbi:hypothetical protein [Rubritalea sp.]|uniref:hypothetical protein n=1 Tax=Rubritalea sp. TaxID=2109375 RepID=UPI003EF4032C